MHRLAIYDLDRTITAVPTWTPFVLHAARTRAPWRLAFAPVVVGAMLTYRAGLIERRTLKQLMHRLMVGTLAPDQSAAVAQSFADRFARHVRPGARAQIAADRAAGYRIVVASAAHRFYAARIAAALGIDDVIATEAEVDAKGRVTHRIAGANCYGADKLAMIEAWMAREGLARADAYVRFYSDHATDEPTFAWANEAIAVNPHARLRTMAGERGWPIVDWR
ncbi:HAD-IB family hydrolase [uncultured Sphingomonas sp.]|uniref:HAD family hydrolase n=1 Tax=uncultured Sphingomonas sp. TaxID=158754 RepID=UPI0025FDE374|nr:HAD-IB family hydrolase [uncultured Sphingomonas sp.]